MLLLIWLSSCGCNNCWNPRSHMSCLPSLSSVLYFSKILLDKLSADY
uniref:Uncharacterized protein n=1 Tax=Arundo donax TaxID=35708 RepID=A0A0A9CB87_ARUDO